MSTRRMRDAIPGEPHEETREEAEQDADDPAEHDGRPCRGRWAASAGCRGRSGSSISRPSWSAPSGYVPAPVRDKVGGRHARAKVALGRGAAGAEPGGAERRRERTRRARSPRVRRPALAYGERQEGTRRTLTSGRECAGQARRRAGRRAKLIGDEGGRGDDQRDAGLHNGKVLVLHRLDDQPPDPRPGEHRLCDHGAPQELARGQDRHHGHHGDQGVAGAACQKNTVAGMSPLARAVRT